jgi:hypothetical protein
MARARNLNSVSIRDLREVFNASGGRGFQKKRTQAE